MEIRIKVEGPRWLKAPKRRSTKLAVALVAALVVAVPVAMAAHTFADVPDANPHHADITAIRGAGITSGCNPPTNNLYCPGNAVLRQEMASFLRRGFGRLAQDSTTNAPDLPKGNLSMVSILTEDMVVPGVDGGSQAVLVNAWARFDTAITGNCEFAARVVQDVGTAGALASPETVIDVASTDDLDATVHVSFAFRTTSGSHQYTLQLQNWNGCTTPATAFTVTNAVINVATFPFDQLGSFTGLSGTPPRPANAPVKTDALGN